MVEFDLPTTPEEIKRRLLSTPGRTEEGLKALESIIEQGIAEGRIRTRISCEEFRRGWFAMARNMYVENNPPRIPQDVEAGIHQGSCLDPVCQMLGLIYFQVLSAGRFHSPEKLAKFLNNLEEKLNLLQDNLDDLNR